LIGDLVNFSGSELGKHVLGILVLGKFVSLAFHGAKDRRTLVGFPLSLQCFSNASMAPCVAAPLKNQSCWRGKWFWNDLRNNIG
jgi:hypothetical protein